MNSRNFILFLSTFVALTLLNSFEANAAVYRTKNFVVETSDPELARQFALTAEYHRRKQAIDWLGKPLPDWAKPCQIKVKVGENLAPGGATTFVFANGEVYDWDMNIQGSAERIIDSVIPHEVTHTIFACRFRKPVPRWVDEGAATSVEHISERTKYRNMLIEFLQTNRGIPFRTMVNAKEYPADAMPFYAQSFTAAEYLIASGGRSRYIAFVEEGIQTENWSAALQHHYGYLNLEHFQNVWLSWVEKRFPTIDGNYRNDTQIASANTASNPQNFMVSAAPVTASSAKVARPEPNLMLRTPVSTAHPNMVVSAAYDAPVQTHTTTGANQSRANAKPIAGFQQTVPQPQNDLWEVQPASYNEIAPASDVVPARVAPFKTTNSSSNSSLLWLPGDSKPLYNDSLNHQQR